MKIIVEDRQYNTRKLVHTTLEGYCGYLEMQIVELVLKEYIPSYGYIHITNKNNETISINLQHVHEMTMDGYCNISLKYSQYYSDYKDGNYETYVIRNQRMAKYDKKNKEEQIKEIIIYQEDISRWD